MDVLTTKVLIVGAGPAGLALAADLGSRGLACVIVERRSEPTAHPKATLLGARSMEYYRGLGIADDILRAGLPTSYGYDVIFATRLSGRVLHHFSSPSPDDYMAMARNERAAVTDAAWTPYFKVQIGQHKLEPIVRRYVEALPSVTVRYHTELVSFEDVGDCVTAVVRDLDTGTETQVRADYMAACDGGRSVARLQYGIPYTGRGAMRRNVSFLFRSDDFGRAATVGRGNLYFMFTPGNFGVFTMINGKDIWNYQHYVLDEDGPDEEIDPVAEIRMAMGRDFEFEVLHTMHWSHHQSVADSFRRNRVFLVGDSAHLFCPTGGIGMNTAIGDAFDLGWKLSAVLQGWGGPKLLDAYETERRPIAFRNTMAAASNADRIDSLITMTPATIDDDTPEGDASRARLLQRLKWLSKQFSSMGLHVGYRYADSPIIVADGSPEPPDDPRIVVQSTWPGCRAPHAWIEPGVRSTLDAYSGARFTLVATRDGDPGAFAAAARDLRVPFACVRFAAPEIAALYERKLVLVRPDGHVAWRGDAAPTDPQAILQTVTGH